MGGLTFWADIATIIATTVVIGGIVAGWVNRSVKRVTDQVQHLAEQTQQHFIQLETQTRTVTLALHTLIPSITWKADGENGPDVTVVRSQLAQMLIQGIRLEETWHNPLSDDELNRLKTYQQVLARNGNLSVEEAEDMKNLAERMAAEHPDNSTIVSLLLLATLFLALLLASRQP
jgi:hypothetical protein